MTKVRHYTVKGKQVLCAAAGEAVVALQMFEWVRCGRKQEDFPSVQLESSRAVDFVLIEKADKAGQPHRIFLYQNGLIPIRIEEKIFAEGSGRGCAIAALYLGQDARTAVEIASMFDSSCGNGVDAVSFD